MSGFIVSVLRLMTRSLFDTQSEEGLRKGAYLLMGFAFAFSFAKLAYIFKERNYDEYLNEPAKRHNWMCP